MQPHTCDELLCQSWKCFRPRSGRAGPSARGRVPGTSRRSAALLDGAKIMSTLRRRASKCVALSASQLVVGQVDVSCPRRHNKAINGHTCLWPRFYFISSVRPIHILGTHGRICTSHIAHRASGIFTPALSECDTACPSSLFCARKHMLCVPPFCFSCQILTTGGLSTRRTGRSSLRKSCPTCLGWPLKGPILFARTVHLRSARLAARQCTLVGGRIRFACMPTV